jgi:hypothetical protein
MRYQTNFLKIATKTSVRKDSWLKFSSEDGKQSLTELNLKMLKTAGIIGPPLCKTHQGVESFVF